MKENIVLITFDSLRADHCGHMGYERNTTPNLDQFFSEGCGYTDAMSPASRTNPSMSGIFTGEQMIYDGPVKNPKHSRAHLQKHETIASDLKSSGYRTGAFCPNAYASRYYGFDYGFDSFNDFMFTNESYQSLFDKHISESDLYTTLRNIRNFVQREEAFRTWESYIDRIETWVNESREPFFLWVFSMDTHYPYLTPKNHRKFSNLLEMYYYNYICYRILDNYDIEVSDETMQCIRDIYDDSIKFADQFLSELKRRLEPHEPTYVIHADHGEALAEHGFYGHFYPSLYQENVHVPLVVSGKNIPDSTIESPISLLQLRKMINDISAGAFTPETYPSKGSIFLSEYDGVRDRQVRSIRKGQLKFHSVIENANTKEELYDLTEDPKELENISDEYKNGVVQFRRLVQLQRQHESEVLRLQDIIQEQSADKRLLV
ncbi:hypothetical protein C2R22_13460 [Salinigranum rubrum]|uniref:Sulfatase N-terminal domain-containing protein n=1 Tax=Salinigranum rubrum TaxID=755307 RepID=A0A2I8VKQ9_9EURY|nr:sulfatase [Salinigranum rubrum]AUV82522.1 hypothetical protein C2R22_13460 [Salinigranum rubrum]